VRVFGLSPLARGTHTGTSLFASAGRFIPAGAGNTSSVVIVWPSTAVYPRWRGEHRGTRMKSIAESGLSPLAWGTHNKGKEVPEIIRFIPAGVGNTMPADHNHKTRTVYPRWRGEHLAAQTANIGAIGLSPLAWGTHARSWPSPYRARFIPAGVGNTAVRSRSGSARPVYPRWRGEHRHGNNRE